MKRVMCSALYVHLGLSTEDIIIIIIILQCCTGADPLFASNKIHISNTAWFRSTLNIYKYIPIKKMCSRFLFF